MKISLNINGAMQQVDADSDTPLLWVIRDNIELTGTKYGCGVAQCGACTVHLNGQPIRSCSMPIGAIGDQKITTIEGLQSKQSEAIQAAWDELAVAQCGYCQSGQIMSAAALLKANVNPNDDDINGAMSGNICRCATYKRIRDGVKLAAQKINAVEV
ncbi:MAG: (2Fe-2S)-binding protein [Porticoccaceae bacterium]|jgi:isoquinoline 1-oxidoreductase alpha subunit|nr:(2Fe-2S)-binding protein [Porticoccaceae bacterium]MDG1312387.1 (2Fe-2S)-binding protein [Porticoccaceae bacterium]